MRKPLIVIALFAVACHESDSVGPGPGPVGSHPAAAVIADNLGGSITASGTTVTLDHRIYHLFDAEPVLPVNATMCQQVQGQLWAACDELYQRGLVTGGCDAVATFFFANDTPRCGVRVTIYDPTGVEQTEILALDVSGDPINGYGASCGNLIIDPGESCDDGNHTDWDGCDASCQFEQFNGCETVIEHYFEQSQIAHVDAATWRAPRSHLMVHDPAEAMRPVDASFCNAARGAAQDVCNELTALMPFVGWCEGDVRLEDDDHGAFCSVRLHVGFSQVSPEDAVFTTKLGGILAFTIR